MRLEPKRLPDVVHRRLRGRSSGWAARSAR
jgi:hypothetical protein